MAFTPSTASMMSFAVISVSICAQSDAHQSGSGWAYPPSCCKGKDFGGDCEAIPRSRVRKGPGAFSVILHPGDHHLVTRNQSFLIPYGNESPSGDGDFHICLQPTDEANEADGIGRGGRYHMNCFFAPPDGV